jgi:pantothenate kinase
MDTLITQIIIGSAVIIGGVLYAIHAIKDFLKSAEEIETIEIDHSMQWYAELYEEINKRYANKINKS